jgi:two-component system cell cycle sensor histidine kinase/response regulator CckA
VLCLKYRSKTRMTHIDPIRRISTRRFCLASLFILGAGLVVAAWQGRQFDRHMRASLLNQTALISWSLQADAISELSGTKADTNDYRYLRIQSQLRRTRALYPECRFLYIMRQQANGDIIMQADSETPDSEGYSPPGQLYHEASPELKAAFTNAAAFTEGPVHDRWGSWISAVCPLYHPRTEQLVAVLGMDVDVSLWRRALLASTRHILLITLGALVVLAVGCWTFKTTSSQRRRGQRNAWLTIFVGLILTAAVTTLAHQAEHRQRSAAFRRISGAQASLVQQSIFRMGDQYLEGIARLFMSSDFVDRREFLDYTQHMMNRPYVQYWAWSPVVTRSEREAFEHMVRAGGAATYRITEEQSPSLMQTATEREVYHPICYLEPMDSHQHLLGFDLASDPIQRAALREAATSRLTTCSDATRLPNTAATRDHVAMVRPVFARNDTNRLVGFASVAMQMEYFLARALSRETTHGENANPAHLYWVHEECPPLLLSTTHPDVPPAPPSASAPFFYPGSMQPMVLPISAFGQVFAFVSQPGKPFGQLYPAVAGYRTTLTGLALTALLGALVFVISNRRDALEKMVTERTTQLRASESSYHGLFNAIQQAIYIVDDRGSFVDVNDGALAMYGYSRSELVGRTPEGVAAPGRNDLAAAGEALQKAKAGEPQHIEFWGQRKNGQIFPKEVWLYPGTYFGRSVVVAVATDISERKRAEQELLDTHERLNTFIEAIPDTVQIKDGEGRWQLINQAAARIFLVENHPWLGKTDAQLAEERPRLGAMHEACSFSDLEAWEKRGTTTHTETISTPQGPRLYEVLKLPLFEPDGRRKALIAIGRDVTERTQAEEEKDRLQTQLQQAQKLESIGRLAGGVAHDFNNMLQAILGNATLALEESPDGPLSEYLVEIKKSAQRSADLTRQLLAFASRQTISPRVIDLNDTIGGMLKMLRRLIGEEIQLLWAPGADLWPVKMDPSQIDQVLANLAVNARDAINGVGTITIETTNRTCSPNDPMLAEFPGARPGDYVVLTVRDSGKGMDDETRGHIFEPFYTTKGPGKGVGLGLATIFGITKQNHGFIQVQSEPGLGATFCIGLPRTLLVPDTQTENTRTTPARGKGETVLLVEDEEVVLRFGRDGLTKLGYQVLSAHSPEEALAAARQAGSRLDILVTDVVLPSMNGHALARQIIDLVPGIKCLFMSGYTADIIAHRGVLDAKVNFIQKPFTLDALATKIRGVLDEPPAPSKRA